MSETPVARRVDWSAQLGPAAPAVLAVLIYGVAAVGAEVLHWQGYYAILAGSALMVVLAMVLKIVDTPQPVVLYLSFCVMAASVWIAWALVVGAWRSDVLFAWLAGLLVLGAPYWVVGRRHPGGVASAASPAAGGGHAAAGMVVQDAERQAQINLIKEWQDRVYRICDKVVLGFIGLEVWPGHTGYTITWELPGGGVTRKTVDSKKEELATDADLPESCGVEVLGLSRRRFEMQISLIDTMVDPRSYFQQFPGLPPTSINHPIPIGWHRDNTLAEADMREDTWILVGQKGSGKSNELDILTAGLARCVDEMTWVIDIPKAGTAGISWVVPWVQGRTPKPAVDWIAPTPEEALLMTEFALQLLRRRQVAYQRLMAEHNSKILPVSARVPAIRIIVDEIAEVAGLGTKYTRISNNLQEINRVGRAMAIDVIPCSLRATSEMIPVTFKSQSRVRIGMRVVDESEVGHLFGWRQALDVNDIKYQGCGFWRVANERIRPFRGWNMEPADIDAIAERCGHYKPDLDAISLDVELRKAYEGRWKRTIPLLFEGMSAPKPYVGPALAPVDTGGHQADPTGGHVAGHGTTTVVDPEVDTGDGMDDASRRLLAGGQDASFGLVSAFGDALERFQRAGRDQPEEPVVPPSPEGARHLAASESTELREMWERPTYDPLAGRHGVGEAVVEDGDEGLFVPGHGGPDPARAHERMIEILLDRGPSPMAGTEVIQALRAEGYPNPDKTIYHWLGRPPVVKVGSRGFVHERHGGGF